MHFPDISDLPSGSSGGNKLFRFGKRWRYSKKYKNNDGMDKMNTGKYSDWFVSQKYTNLKREILSNTNQKLPVSIWNQLNAKAQHIIQTLKIKSIQSCKTIKYELKFKDILKNGPISIDHVICILIYCNFEAIKTSLNDTYRPMNKFEEWKDVRAKHSG